MRAAAPAAAVLLCAVIAACTGDLEKQSHVSKLRVLGVRADPAELIVTPDGGVPATSLEALAVDPSGGPVTVRYALCTEITQAPAATLDCPGDAGIDLPAEGATGARLDLSDPRILAFAAAASSDGGFDAGGLQATLDQGVPLLVGFRATSTGQDGGVEQLSGFASITLRSPAAGPVNQNPDLAGLQIAPVIDGDAGVPQDVPADGGFVTAAGALVHLVPVPVPKDDAAEKYGYSFFATAGEVGSLRSTDTTSTGQPAPTWVEWTAPDAGGPVTLWVVVRDGRGGTGWLERRIDAR